MKLLLENFRNFLLLEAAFSPEDLPEGVYVKLSQDTISSGDMIVAELADEDGRAFDEGEQIYGYVSAVKPKKAMHGPCLDAYIIGQTYAQSGWGPMMYDLAMELAGANGLTPDRESLSKEAYSVWDYYLKSRSDVEAKQLDDLKNTITGDEEDNCNPKSAGDHSKLVKYAPIKPLRKKGLTASPVMKAYVKKDKATLAALEKLGKIKR
jgi:hypothetical protein